MYHLQASGRLAGVLAVAYELAEQGAMDEEEEELPQLFNGESPLPPLPELSDEPQKALNRKPSGRRVAIVPPTPEGPIESVDGELLADEEVVLPKHYAQVHGASRLLKRIGKPRGTSKLKRHDSDDESSESSRDDEPADSAANQNALHQLELKCATPRQPLALRRMCSLRSSLQQVYTLSLNVASSARAGTRSRSARAHFCRSRCARSSCAATAPPPTTRSACAKRSCKSRTSRGIGAFWASCSSTTRPTTSSTSVSSKCSSFLMSSTKASTSKHQVLPLHIRLPIWLITVQTCCTVSHCNLTINILYTICSYCTVQYF